MLFPAFSAGHFPEINTREKAVRRAGKGTFSSFYAPILNSFLLIYELLSTSMVFSKEKKKHLLPENRSKMIEKMMLSRVLLLLSIALEVVLSRSPITQHYAINNTLLIHNSTAQFASILYLAELCVCVNFLLIMIRRKRFSVFVVCFWTKRNKWSLWSLWIVA